MDGVRLPKEAYYVCQTMFRDDPQVFIIGHWTYPAGTKKTVYVTSNAEEVELFVNGKSLGRAKPKDRYLFTFPDVVWQPGEIKAVAYTGGKAVATTSKHTVGPPVALEDDADHRARRMARRWVGHSADRRRSGGCQGRALPHFPAARRFRNRSAPPSGAAATTAARSNRRTTRTSISKPASTASPYAPRARPER